MNGNPIPISSGGMSYGNEPMIELYAVTQEQYDAVHGPHRFHNDLRGL